MKSRVQYNGMVLIELILSVVLICSLLVITPPINKKICDYKINYFIKGFKSDLQYGLSYSMTHFTLVKLKIVSNESYYKLTDGSLLMIKKTIYNKTLHIDSYIMLDTIEITHGNVNKYGYFYLSCGVTKYKITIYEKSGILNVVKS